MRGRAGTDGRPFRPGLGLTERAFLMATPTQGDSKEDPAVGSLPSIAVCSDNECVLDSFLENPETKETSLIENWIDA